jgi:hypothetical protein
VSLSFLGRESSFCGERKKGVVAGPRRLRYDPGDGSFPGSRLPHTLKVCFLADQNAEHGAVSIRMTL